MNQQIAFLGLGVMGSPMTANLVRRGYHVKAWNRTPTNAGVAIAKEAGATIVPSIAEAVSNAQIIFTCLGDIADVEAVLLSEGGVKDFADADALIVDMSTIGSQAAQNIALALEKYSLRFLDAPVSGGDIGAIQGTLTIMVGGREEDFDECQPLLAAMGQTIRLCGGVGSGQAVKMCNQILCSLYLVGISEAMEMAKAQGIDPNLVVEICNTGAAGSWALANLGPKIIAEDYAPGFAIKHLLKDLRIVGEIGEKTQKNLPGVKLAQNLLSMVEDKEKGTQAMIQAYRVISEQL